MKKSTTLTLVAVGVGALAAVAGFVAYKMCNNNTKCICSCKDKKVEKEPTQEEVRTDDFVEENDVESIIPTEETLVKEKDAEKVEE